MMKFIKLFLLKITIIVSCLLVSSISYSQSAITVEIVDIQVDQNGTQTNGSYEIFFAETIFPVFIDGFGPCGFDPQGVQLNSGSVENNDITCPGEYCYTVIKNFGTASLECTETICFVVKICKPINGGIKICTDGGDGTIGGGGPGNEGKFFYASGNTKISKDKRKFDMDYQTYVKTHPNDAYVTKSKTSLINEDIEYKIRKGSIELLIARTTEDVIEHQTEIETEDDYIFKFDSEGELIWAYDNSKNKFKEAKIREGNNTLNSVENKMNFSKDLMKKPIEELSLYPNPFSDELNITFQSANEGTADMHLINAYGQIIFVKAIQLEKGRNFHQIIPNSPLFNGLYFVQIIDDLGNKYIKQAIYINN